jgi:hypothetical protein
MPSHGYMPTVAHVLRAIPLFVNRPSFIVEMDLALIVPTTRHPFTLPAVSG